MKKVPLFSHLFLIILKKLVRSQKKEKNVCFSANKCVSLHMKKVLDDYDPEGSFNIYVFAKNIDDAKTRLKNYGFEDNEMRFIWK